VCTANKDDWKEQQDELNRSNVESLFIDINVAGMFFYIMHGRVENAIAAIPIKFDEYYSRTNTPQQLTVKTHEVQSVVENECTQVVENTKTQMKSLEFNIKKDDGNDKNGKRKKK